MTARTPWPAAPPPAVLPYGLSPEELARAGAEWFARVEELAKHDPAAAERLYATMWAHLSQCRPESPCSLSERIAPTEAPPTKPPEG